MDCPLENGVLCWRSNTASECQPKAITPESTPATTTTATAPRESRAATTALLASTRSLDTGRVST